MPFRRTAFDLLLALFLVTAAGAVWAAYNHEQAWAKFWVIASAVMVYYALAHQPPDNLWQVAGLASGLGAFIAGYFLLTHNWKLLPADIGLLNRLGLGWMSVRPELSLRPLYDNIAGGLTAMLLPFPLALGLRALRERRMPMGLFAVAAGGLTAAGLLMTSSRAAWFALAAAVGVWIVWGLSGVAARRTGRSRALIFVLVALAACGPALMVILNYPGGLAALVDKLPGLPNGASRLDLARDAYHLTEDFLFTGGGLGAFSGLYSRYVMIIPVFLFGYSHNFLLDVALEQGVFGFLALATVMLGSAGMLIAQIWRGRDAASDLGLLRCAILCGLIVVGLHGLLGDALYGEGGTPLLFLFAGMAVAARPPDAGTIRVALPAHRTARRWTMGIVGVMAGGVLLLVACYRPLLSSWYANLGAVQMARLELAGWRDDATNDFGQPDLSSAEVLFQKALQVNPGSRTAHHRLGLIAMRSGDFGAAVAHLEAARQTDKSDRGVNKVLGYAYVWQGQLDQALPLLAEIPEARDELNVYTWWWGTQGRDDLAEHAAQTVARLGGAPASQTP